MLSGAVAQLGERLLCKQEVRRFETDRLHHSRRSSVGRAPDL